MNDQKIPYGNRFSSLTNNSVQPVVSCKSSIHFNISTPNPRNRYPEGVLESFCLFTVNRKPFSRQLLTVLDMTRNFLVENDYVEQIKSIDAKLFSSWVLY